MAFEHAPFQNPVARRDEKFLSSGRGVRVKQKPRHDQAGQIQSPHRRGMIQVARLERHADLRHRVPREVRNSGQ